MIVCFHHENEMIFIQYSLLYLFIQILNKIEIVNLFKQKKFVSS